MVGLKQPVDLTVAKSRRKAETRHYYFRLLLLRPLLFNVNAPNSGIQLHRKLRN